MRAQRGTTRALQKQRAFASSLELPAKLKRHSRTKKLAALAKTQIVFGEKNFLVAFQPIKIGCGE
jgi:hypothetical protein